MRRRDFGFREGAHWTVRHLNWIRQVLQPETLADEDRIVLAEYLALLEYKLQRRDDLDSRIQELALSPRYKPVVDRLCCFRGFKTQAAMVLATELGDVRRFESLFHRLAARKPDQVAATAVARELVGFLWAVLRDVDIAELQEVSEAA